MSEKQFPEVQVLIEYLRAFLPADDTDTDVILKSSQDIQDDLADMIEIPLADITKEMLECCYRIEVDADNKPKWRMMRN